MVSGMETTYEETERSQGHGRFRFIRTVALVTVSDSGARGEREDCSGDALVQSLESRGYPVVYRSVVPDEMASISMELCRCSDEKNVALIVTTGGTGVSPRDVTPEATLSVIDRQVPGMGEAMRSGGLAVTPYAMISRGVVGIRKATLIINLPGSPKGALENLQVVLPVLDHVLEKIQGDTRDCARQ